MFFDECTRFYDGFLSDFVGFLGSGLHNLETHRFRALLDRHLLSRTLAPGDTARLGACVELCETSVMSLSWQSEFGHKNSKKSIMNMCNIVQHPGRNQLTPQSGGFCKKIR